jgi:glycine cleavage system H protein
MRFTDSHEWINLKGTAGTVGITDYAQGELGEIVFIELPKVGQQVKAGEEIAVLESTKAAADVYAPVSGKITAINEVVKANPNLINRFAEGEGWLFQLEVSHPKEFDHLLTKPQYNQMIS